MREAKRMKNAQRVKTRENEIKNRLCLRFDGMIPTNSRQMPNAMKARVLEVIDEKMKIFSEMRSFRFFSHSHHDFRRSTEALRRIANKYTSPTEFNEGKGISKLNESF